MRISLLFALLAITPGIKAQDGVRFDQTKSVKDVNGKLLNNAWAGGLNSVHLSEIDLNFDGILDLFVYDLEGQRKLTFVNKGTSNEIDYTYAPEYAEAFPDIENFFQFIDYNQDGKKDLFIAYNGGIKLYKNTSDKDKNMLSFEEYPYLEDYPFLTADYSGTRSNLFVSRGDAPGIADIDSDGDIDIVSFSNLGGRVNYYINNASQKSDPELMDFSLATSCWGNFEEGFDSPDITLGISCKGNNGVPKDKGNKHAGSTLLAFDADGDNDMDLLVGDVLSYNMIFLENGGDSLFADMTSQNALYPTDKPIDIRIYPAAHFLDLNNDGKRDLVITPNTLGAVENATSLWYYENKGEDNAPLFEFKTFSFLQNQMIEVGEGSYPTFFDYDQNSVPDLVVGNYGYFSNNSIARSVLQLYHTDANYNFELTDTNIAGISELILNENLGTPTLNLVPAFGDLNGDGVEDMLIGDFEGKIHYFKNSAPVGSPANFVLESKLYQDIDVGGYAAPQLFDLNEDGLLDLIVGERNGVLNYYQNNGSKTQALFELISDTLGGVNVVPDLFFTGYSYPFFFKSNDTIKLLCGSQSGKIYYYDNINNNLNGKFNLVTDNFGGIDAGTRSSVAGTDLDEDGMLELVIGNYSGGLSFFESDITFTPANIIIDPPTPKNKAEFNFEIIPVPSNGYIRLSSVDGNFNDEIFDVKIFNSIGLLVYEKSNTFKKKFDLRGMSSGIYYIQLRNSNNNEVKAFVINGNYEMD